MARFNDQILEEIKSRVDLVDLIGSVVQLKRSGADYKGCCPFHQEKTPSFIVHSNEQYYHCFGCGASGNVFTFLMKQEGLTFEEAVQKLADRVGVTLEKTEDPNAKLRARLYALHAELANFYRRCLLRMKEGAAARAYLLSRKLPETIQETFCIGYAPVRTRNAVLRWAEKYGFTPDELVAAGVLLPGKKAGDAYYDRFKGRLMFPICDRQGRVVGFSGRILDVNAHPAKYVNSPETLIFTKSKILYALDKAAAKIVKHPRREAIVCEGQIDVIRCHASGFESAVASQGTAFTADHVALLKRYADSVVLVFDGDGAGRKATLRTGALFLQAEIPVRVATLPTGEDPDSLLRDRGADAFREVLDQARSITAFQIETLRAEEQDPESIDAVDRMNRQVMEMLAGCPSAVLRARLLQEASERLHLPLTAMEEDLERFRESSSRGRLQGRKGTPRPDEEALSAESRTADHSMNVSEEVMEPSRPEYLLCELLVECERDEKVLNLVHRYLPLDWIEHPLIQGVVSAILTAADGDDQAFPAYCATVPEKWQPLLARLLVNRQKMLSARESTPEEAARDLVLAIWVARIRQMRGRLDADSTPENDAERLRLSCLIKTLETQPWEKVQSLIGEGSSLRS